MKPLYIFDLDGTLALTDHRAHLVRCENPNWDAFFEACVDDQPNYPVIETLHNLIESGAEVRIWSGRSNAVMSQTLEWFHKHLDMDIASEIPLLMRVEGDFTPDDRLKSDWYDQLNEFEKKRLIAVFDDRNKVVEMWRSKGVACFQVATGDF